VEEVWFTTCYLIKTIFFVSLYKGRHYAPFIIINCQFLIPVSLKQQHRRKYLLFFSTSLSVLIPSLPAIVSLMFDSARLMFCFDALMFSTAPSESNFDGLMSGIVGQLFPAVSSESDTIRLTSNTIGLTSSTVRMTSSTVRLTSSTDRLTSSTDRLHQNNGLKHVSFDFSVFFFAEVMKMGNFECILERIVLCCEKCGYILKLLNSSLSRK